MTAPLKPCKLTGHAYYEREDDLRHCAQCGGAEASMPTMCPGRTMTELEQNDVMAGTLDFSRGSGIKPKWWITKERMDHSGWAYQLGCAVAEVVEQLPDNEARIRWLWNPVPEGQLLLWNDI